MHKNIKKTTLPQINSRIINGHREKTHLLSKISSLIFLIKNKAVISLFQSIVNYILSIVLCPRQLSFVNY